MNQTPYQWSCLLVDLDGTLLEFPQSEHGALMATLHQAGFQGTAQELETYHQVNDSLWHQVEQGKMEVSTLRWLRFQHFLERMHRDTAMAHPMSDWYVIHFAQRGHALPGAMDLLETCHPRMTICALSNGIGEIQRGRLQSSGISPLIDHVVISDEQGISKPDPRIFQIALNQCGCRDKNHAVMLGDSLTSDIAGANAAGIASIHLRQTAAVSHSPTFQVCTLQEAAALLSKYTATPDGECVVTSKEE